MIKGWRNDPSWVEYYVKRNNERTARRLALMQAAQQRELMMIEAEAMGRIREMAPDWAGKLWMTPDC